MQSVGTLKTLTAPGDDRVTRRHSLSLGTQASSKGLSERALIHNISSTGLLIEAELELEIGEEIEVELPRVDSRNARVVWLSDGFYGCRFVEPLSEAVVSAARLRSMPSWLPSPNSDPKIDGNQRADDHQGLTLRQRALIIIALAASCWAATIMIASLAF